MTAMVQTSSSSSSSSSSADDGWADVLGAYRTDLVRTARSRLGSGGADAEDVVHDVVVRVLRGRKDAAEMATPAAYLRRAVGNESVSRWRRTSREVVVAELPDRPRPAADEAVLDKLVLGEAVRTLTPRQRRVLALTVLDDRPDSEAAAELGISEVTVRTTRSRALARLREKLTAMELADQRPITRSGVTRITTRTVPSGSAGSGSPVHLADSSSISPRPAASDGVASPRISA